MAEPVVGVGFGTGLASHTVRISSSIPLGAASRGWSPARSTATPSSSWLQSPLQTSYGVYGTSSASASWPMQAGSILPSGTPMVSLLSGTGPGADLLSSEAQYQPVHHHLVVSYLTQAVRKLKATGERLKRLAMREALLDWHDAALGARLQERLQAASKVLRGELLGLSQELLAQKAEQAAQQRGSKAWERKKHGAAVTMQTAWRQKLLRMGNRRRGAPTSGQDQLRRRIQALTAAGYTAKGVALLARVLHRVQGRRLTDSLVQWKAVLMPDAAALAMEAMRWDGCLSRYWKLVTLQESDLQDMLLHEAGQREAERLRAVASIQAQLTSVRMLCMALKGCETKICAEGFFALRRAVVTSPKPVIDKQRRRPVFHINPGAPGGSPLDAHIEVEQVKEEVSGARTITCEIGSGFDGESTPGPSPLDSAFHNLLNQDKRRTITQARAVANAGYHGGPSAADVFARQRSTSNARAGQTGPIQGLRRLHRGMTLAPSIAASSPRDSIESVPFDRGSRPSWASTGQESNPGDATRWAEAASKSAQLSKRGSTRSSRSTHDVSRSNHEVPRQLPLRSRGRSDMGPSAVQEPVLRALHRLHTDGIGGHELFHREIPEEQPTHKAQLLPWNAKIGAEPGTSSPHNSPQTRYLGPLASQVIRQSPGLWAGEDSEVPSTFMNQQLSVMGKPRQEFLGQMQQAVDAQLRAADGHQGGLSAASPIAKSGASRSRDKLSRAETLLPATSELQQEQYSRTSMRDPAKGKPASHRMISHHSDAGRGGFSMSAGAEELRL